jgi:hypothetical protein
LSFSFSSLFNISRTVVALGFILMACSPEQVDEPSCGDSVCSLSETPSTCPQDCPVSCGDSHCTSPEESEENCPQDCTFSCTPLADISSNIQTGQLFFGYPTLGTRALAPSCGSISTQNAVYISFTPDFTGQITLSTANPSTTAGTIIEIRQGTCDGSSIHCTDGTTFETTTATFSVVASQAYVAAIYALPIENSVFTLSIHPKGVCEENGLITDITTTFLTGEQFAINTSQSSSSLGASCGGSQNPEAKYNFTAPKNGVILATTAHPDTNFDTLLHVGEQWDNDGKYCGSPEVEIACNNDGSEMGTQTLLRFNVNEGISYNLFVDGNGTNGSGNATLTLGYETSSPSQTSLEGCNHNSIMDSFAFYANSGQEITAKVDTIDSATAADMRLMIRLPDGSELHEADDDFDCTYPPPSYSCPAHTFTASTSGLYMVDVYVGSSEACANNNLINYELSVTLNTEHIDLIQFGDE